ncbi:uncharacterized protein KQ657_003843 [Scheffersomyces spartinae]|uniref:SH3 domain-containing protein n=1 Tax=Scheffersomyces spartinae TaxID=45513 RepID=A0A9P8AJY3_9ASCO|nr:uncharacterized protein KQ657_003843 [Scheffersomyces spartinae]KAG7195315.1 hypothetical protein KQ657_003843 [Scheffersomyces spartinae]
MTDPLPPFKVKALYTYENDYEDDLTFSAGQILTVTVVEDDQWYTGTYDGQEGIFPRNFVEIYHELPPVPVSRPTPKSPNRETTAATANATKESKDNIVVDEVKPKLSDSIGTGPIPKPVLPGGHKVADPYSVTKQFMATGKSSYVPQVTPRDQANVIHTIPASSSSHAPPPDVVRETSQTVAQEEEEPKVSLKERIALLKKRQEEEAEREAAALKREEERKKKAAEKAKLKKQKALNQHTTGDSVISAGSVDGGAELLNANENTEEGITEEGEESSTVKVQGEDNELGSVENREGNEEDDEEEDAEAAEEEEEEESEEPTEEEDDEELKRRRLVERMAKISGGRSMFGMMGMATPFSQATQASTPKRTKSVKKLSDESDEVSKAKPIPILPMVGNTPIPSALKKSVNSPEASKVQDSSQYPESESSVMIEDDIATESDSRILEPQEFKIDPVRPSLASDGEVDTYQSNMDSNIRITTSLDDEKEKEPTGYEADEDLSDIARTSTITGPSALDSPVKTSIPPAPPVQVPPTLPSLPRLSTGLNDVDDSTIPNTVPPPPPSTIPRSPTMKQPKVPSIAPPIPKVISSSSSTIPRGPAIGSMIPPPIPSAPKIPTSHPVDVQEEKLVSEKEVSNNNNDEVDNDQTTDSEEQEEYDDVTSEEVGDRDIIQHAESEEDQDIISPTLAPPALPYGIPQIPKTAPFAPSIPAVPSSAPPPVASEELTNESISYATALRAATDASLGRKSSIKGDEQTNAELVLSELEFEIANITGNSNWWLKGELPDSLIQKARSDLIYEVDSHEIRKRGGRVVNFRDYYVLFYDLSQLVFEIEFEKDDPRSSIKLVNSLIMPVPTIHKDLLNKYRNEYGDRVVLEASSLLGLIVTGEFVDLILNKFSSELIQPIGNKSCGVTIYKNFNNHNIAKIDDIRAGDILWIKNGKFQSHKVMGSKVISVGDHEVHKSIIYEYDTRKDKIRVIEQESNGLIKKESYKLTDFKSGKLRVFRLVGRDYVNW